MPMLCLRLATRFPSVGDLMEALAGLRRKEGCFAQAFDPRAIVSERHLLVAYENAKRAFGEKRNVARTIEAEVLARAGGTRKIGEAIERVGARDARDVLVLCDCTKGRVLRELGGKERRPAFAPDEKGIARRFGISKGALSACSLEEAVLEKVALADVAD